MATAELTNTYLTFDNGATQYARMTAFADAFNFAGAGGVNTVLLSNLTNPASAQDAATKNYVDNLVNGLSWKNEVSAATTADITLDNTTTSVDGVTVTDGMRILVKDQVVAIDNGIYIGSTSGAWTRSADMATGSDAVGDATFVSRGSTNSDKAYVCNSFPAIVGTDALNFVVLTSSVPVAGGVNTQLQYNNAGTFGGMSNWTTGDNGLTLTATAGTLTLDNDSFMNIATTEISYDGSTPVLKVYNSNASGTTRFYGNSGFQFVVSDDSAGYQTYFQFDSSTGTTSVTNGNTGVLTTTHNGTDAVINTTAGDLNLTSALAAANLTGAVGASMTATTGTAAVSGATTTVSSTTAGVTITGAVGASMTATTGTAAVSGATTTVSSTTAGVTVTGATGVSVVNQSATNPTIMKLGDAAGATEFRVDDSSNITQFKVNSDGEGTFLGNVYGTAFYATSDAVLKTNIESLSDPLDRINNIEGYQYNWKDQNADQELQFGVIAQQLEEAGLGNLVSNNNGHKTVNYIGLIPLLIGAIKELSKKVDNLA